MGVALVLDKKCKKCKHFDEKVKPQIADSYGIVGFCYRYAAWVAEKKYEMVPHIECRDFKYHKRER